jgi:hypothetical protein
MTNQTNELVVTLKESGLQQNKVEMLLNSFGESFQQAKEIVNNSKDIVVTEETQTELMKQARTARLSLRKLRSDVENNRKTLKEQSLREGKAIDGIANIIKALVIPVEEHLEQQEKFAELRAAERKAKRLADRIQQFSKYVSDVSLYNLDVMSDEAFEKLVSDAETAYQAKLDADAKVEAERLAKIEADKKEQERIRLENEVLRKKTEQLEAEKKRAEQAAAKEREAQELKVKKMREEQELKAAEERKKQAEALRIEREKREKIEADIQAKKAAEDARLKAEQEAKRKALLAPDKEKLREFAASIENISMPAVSSNEAQQVLNKAQAEMHKIINIVRNEAKKL